MAQRFVLIRNDGARILTGETPEKGFLKNTVTYVSSSYEALQAVRDDLLQNRAHLLKSTALPDIYTIYNADMTDTMAKLCDRANVQLTAGSAAVFPELNVGKLTPIDSVCSTDFFHKDVVPFYETETREEAYRIVAERAPSINMLQTIANRTQPEQRNMVNLRNQGVRDALKEFCAGDYHPSSPYSVIDTVMQVARSRCPLDEVVHLGNLYLKTREYCTQESNSDAAMKPFSFVTQKLADFALEMRHSLCMDFDRIGDMDYHALQGAERYDYNAACTLDVIHNIAARAIEKSEAVDSMIHQMIAGKSMQLLEQEGVTITATPNAQEFIDAAIKQYAATVLTSFDIYTDEPAVYMAISAAAKDAAYYCKEHGDYVNQEQFGLVSLSAAITAESYEAFIAHYGDRELALQKHSQYEQYIAITVNELNEKLGSPLSETECASMVYSAQRQFEYNVTEGAVHINTLNALNAIYSVANELGAQNIAYAVQDLKDTVPANMLDQELDEVEIDD